MIFLTLMMLLNPLAHSESVAPAKAIVRNISLFKNEIQLDIVKSRDIKVGSKFLAQTSVNHKCLLIVTRIVRDLAYADATQCPGYATLKKGQSVEVSAEAEVNEEIKSPPPAKSENI